MRYVAAAMLLSLAGGEINKKNIKKILDSVGVECEDDKIQLVIDQLKGKDINELLMEGKEKLGSVPAGAGVAASGAGGDAGAGAGAAAAADAAPAAKAKEEEPEEESDDDMGFGLFD